MIVRMERRDFGREMSMVVVEPGAERGVDVFYSVVEQNGYHLLKEHPVREGDRIPEDAFFLRLNDIWMQKFLTALVVELARHGYVTPDPHGVQTASLKDHVSTLQKENDRHFDLAKTLAEAVTAIAQRKPGK